MNTSNHNEVLPTLGYTKYMDYVKTNTAVCPICQKTKRLSSFIDKNNKKQVNEICNKCNIKVKRVELERSIYEMLLNMTKDVDL